MNIIGVETGVETEVINRQQPHWEKVFENSCSRFGDEPSYPARKEAVNFEREGKNEILELGCDQGRDTCFFTTKGFHIHSLDYTESGLKQSRKKSIILDFWIQQ